MKHSLFPASFLSCLATAACLWVPQLTHADDDPYRMETHGPRIGTRILLFVKDLAYGENPNDRYRQLPANQPRMMAPQQHNYGARPPGERFNLDQPPPMNSMPRQRPPQYAPPEMQQPPQNMAPRDMPYTSAEAPPKERERTDYRGAVEEKQEEVPPVKIKPKTTPPTPKPSTIASKPQVEEAPPKPAPEKRAIPSEGPVKQTQTVSNSTAASKKAWQTFAGDTPAPTPTTTSTPPVENKTPAPPPASNTSATLTGSKTSKEGRVKSPYSPFNELDVTGLPPGSLAMDPTTGKVFRVP